jgi:phosphopantetheine--protein transferase-like protein
LILNWLPLPTGSADCASVYLFDASALAPDDGVLTPQERDRAARQVRRDLAQRWRVTRSVLRHAMAQRVGLAAADVAIVQQARGRLDSPGSALHGSVAAGDTWSMVAASDCALGIDIESVSRIGDSEAIAKRVLRRDQFQRWQLLDAPDRAQELAWQWVAKEAYLKALGVGLDLDPAWLIAPPRTGGEIIDSSGMHVPLLITPLPSPPDYMAAMCELREQPRACRVFRFDGISWA